MSRRVAKGTQPRPVPFTWRGIEFTPQRSLSEGGIYRSPQTKLSDFRSTDWKCQRVGDRWHARLRIGGDRFPGTGSTAEEALDEAAAEARLVAGYVRRLLPASFPAPKGIRARRARRGAA